MSKRKPKRLRPIDLRWPVRLVFGDKSIVIPAVVDSGAQTSLLAFGVAARLGMDQVLRPTISGRMLKSAARFTAFRGLIDRLEILDPVDYERVRISAGPLAIEVSDALSEGEGLLLGADLLSYLRCVLTFRPGQVDLRCDGKSGRLGALMFARLIEIA